MYAVIEYDNTGYCYVHAIFEDRDSAIARGLDIAANLANTTVSDILNHNLGNNIYSFENSTTYYHHWVLNNDFRSDGAVARGSIEQKDEYGGISLSYVMVQKINDKNIHTKS